MPADEELISSDDRRESIRAAAEALRTWVHAQREAGRSGRGLEALPRRADGALQGTPVAHAQAVTLGEPPAADPPSSPPERSFQGMSILGIDTAASEPAAPTWVQTADVVGRTATAVGRSAGAAGLKAGAVGWKAAVATVRAALAMLATHRTVILWWARRAAILALIVGASVAIASGVQWMRRTYGPRVSTTLATLAAQTTGAVLLESVPPGSQLFIDGRVVGTTPITVHLSQGRHLIEFRRGESIRSLEIDVTAGQSTVSRLDWTAKRTGVLRVESAPAGATVIIDGRERGVTPLETSDLTVGAHTVLIQSEAGSVRRSVNIRVDRATEISEVLYSGWMHLSSPIEVEITQGNRALQLDEQNRVLLPPGDHELQFDNRALGYHEVRQVRVSPGETTRVVVAPASSSLSVSATEPAEVLVDGERAGDTPLTNHPVTLGTHDIVVRSASGAERRLTTTVTSTPAQIDVDFSTP